MTRYKVCAATLLILLGVPAAQAQESGAALGEMAIGRADAPVTVVEYASLTCPHCARFHADVLPRIKTAYIDTGKVRLVFRDFPFDRLALAGAMLARCGGAERHSGLLDVLFRQQQSWARAQDPVAELMQIGKLAGLSEQKVQACFSDAALEQSIVRSRRLGEQTYKVTSVPSFLIDGQLVSGGLLYEDFARLLDAAIAKQSPANPAPARSGEAPSEDEGIASTANLLLAGGAVLAAAAAVAVFLSRRKSGAG
ncbi:MAG: DsbA family protein [Alphaproteobacteria bacterium]|nr:DsbA family protein [Alphaproteobacteria bacterium]